MLDCKGNKASDYTSNPIMLNTIGSIDNTISPYSLQTLEGFCPNYNYCNIRSITLPKELIAISKMLTYTSYNPEVEHAELIAFFVGSTHSDEYINTNIQEITTPLADY